MEVINYPPPKGRCPLAADVMDGLLYFKNGRFFITWDSNEANLAGKTLRMHDVTPEVVLALKEFDVLTYERANCSNCGIVCGHKLESGCCGWYEKK